MRSRSSRSRWRSRSVQCPTALGLVHLDLAPGRGRGFLRGALEFPAELGQDRTLVLARRFELLGVGFEPGVRLGQSIALTLRQLA
jgi:hypothetical protein